MTYYEFINRPLRLRDRVMHDADEVAMLFEVCTKANPSFEEKVQTSLGNRSERNYAAWIDANKELNALVERYRAARKEVSDFLYNNLPYEDADLLEWRYLNDKGLKEVAEIKGLAYQTVKNKMSAAEKRAMRKFSNSLPKSTEI